MWGRLLPGALRGRASVLFRGSHGARQGSAPGDPALMQWTLRVSPFWRLRTRLPCHLLVRALDPLAHPDGERVRVAVRGAERGARGLQVEYDAARREVAVLSDDIDPRALVEVDAPLRLEHRVIRIRLCNGAEY